MNPDKESNEPGWGEQWTRKGKNCTTGKKSNDPVAHAPGVPWFTPGEHLLESPHQFPFIINCNFHRIFARTSTARVLSSNRERGARTKSPNPNKKRHTEPNNQLKGKDDSPHLEPKPNSAQARSEPASSGNKRSRRETIISSPAQP